MHVTSVNPVHVVLEALPTQAGYTLRTHYLAQAQRQLGLAPAVVAQPSERLYGGQRVSADGIAVGKIDGVTYYRLSDSNRWRRSWIRITQSLRDRGVRGTYRFGRTFRVPSPNGWDVFLAALPRHLGGLDVVHAHTPHGSARYGLELARRMGVPFVYEVRGFWEMTSETDSPTSTRKRLGQEWAAADTELARQADAVITLGEAMRNELTRRGVEPERVFVVGNGVDAAYFAGPRAKPPPLLRKLDLAGRFILGYVTNVRPLEGIETALRALPILLNAGVPASFVLVGDGDDLPRLREVAKTLKIDQHVRFVGKVPHRHIRSYYSLLDLFVVPRIDARVCRIVTPLKPLEAMALGIPTVVSDLPALTELVQPGVRGVSFEADNPEHLARVVQDLWKDPGRAAALGLAGRQWVQTERNWAQLAQKDLDVYRLVRRCPS